MAAGRDEFLTYLERWLADRPALTFGAGYLQPERTGVLCVDLVNGFCKEGPLANPRVKNIIEPSAALLRQAHAAGVRHFALLQDAHETDAFEFSAFGPHCVAGTSQAETVTEIQALPFYADMAVFPKNTIHAGLNTGLDAWLSQHGEVENWIIVGDCTDLCVYQLAMYLKLLANANRQSVGVIIPANCVDTYDLPVPTAAALGVMPHNADLLHRIFLYHMALNGIEVVAGIGSAEGAG